MEATKPVSAYSGEANSSPAEIRDYVDTLHRKNDRLASALRAAQQELAAVHIELDRLTSAPLTYGTVISVDQEKRQVEVLTGGRKMCLGAPETVALGSLWPGQEVTINEHLNVVGALDYEEIGEVVLLKDIMPGQRVLVQVRNEDERVLRLAEPLRRLLARGPHRLQIGTYLRADLKTGFAYETITRGEGEELALEEVPHVSYGDIGGLEGEITQIRDSIELPFLHPELYRAHQLRPPKGVLLYGPPGCGKTLIAKAVATSLARLKAGAVGGAEDLAEEAGDATSFFLNIKGPQLLNKYVGETERQIREIFARARQRAASGIPVVIFFDEMDALFRTRGTGKSSDVETTIVPQLLAEIDGVENLENVLIIGASNREDMLDPAILRPGRLDVKIRIGRPDQEGARQILSKYLTTGLPLDPAELARFGSPAVAVAAQIDAVVSQLYATNPATEYIQVTYVSGQSETMHLRDFTSGAMLANIVDRAKKMSIKAQLAGRAGGLSQSLLLAALAQEIHENEDLLDITNPDEWARISGRRGERVAFVRTLGSGR